MSVSDALIIYFALGAPVAMFRFFQEAKPFKPLGLANVFASLIFWPLAAVQLIAVSSRTLPHPSNFVTRKNLDVRIIQKVQNLKEQILSDLSPMMGQSVVSAKAEAIERYVGLSMAETDRSLRVEKELFAIAGHPDIEVSAICLARRNAKLLDRHRRQSAEDIVGAFSDQKQLVPNRSSVNEHLVELAILLEDTATAERLAKVTSSRETAEKALSSNGIDSLHLQDRSADGSEVRHKQAA